MPRPLLIALIIVVTLAWVANLAIGWIDPSRSIPAVNTIYGIIIGSLFALGQKDTAVAAIKSIRAKKEQPSSKQAGGDES